VNWIYIYNCQDNVNEQSDERDADFPKVTSDNLRFLIIRNNNIDLTFDIFTRIVETKAAEIINFNKVHY
jgi:hypothetical protein